ncbi:hypothetical protein D3C81_1514420 [compost metagenome]
MHFDFDDAVTTTSLTTATLNVKAKTPFLITPHLSFVCLRIQITNIVKHTGVGCRIRARCTSDWRLIYVYYPLHMLQAFDFAILAWTYFGSV